MKRRKNFYILAFSIVIWIIIIAGCSKIESPTSSEDLNLSQDQNIVLQKSNGDDYYFHLISPSNNSCSEPQVTFRWEKHTPPPGMGSWFSYDVYINDSRVAFIQNQNCTQWSTTLERNQSYDWKIVSRYGRLGRFVQLSEEEWTIKIRPAKPTLSSSYYSNIWISLSWNSIPGAVQYKLCRIGDIRGTINDGWNNMGTSLSVKDYPYEEPTFTSFVPNAFGFATYKVVAVNSNDVESLPSYAVSYGVDYGGGGW